MEEKFDKIKYNARRLKEHYIRINIALRKTDTEVLEKLASVPSKTDYIRQLILADIQKEKEANK